MIRGVAALALAVLAACAAPPPGLPTGPTVAMGPRTLTPRGIPTAPSSPTGAERALVTAILSDLQHRSFEEGREFCGYVGYDRSGRLVPTRIHRGHESSCPLPPVPADMVLVASFHTHGRYSPWYASEWPTTQDMDTDAADGIAGYIATPGGRLWYVDTRSMTVRQLCGRGCLPQDPAYRPEDDGPLRPVMTYEDLRRWETGAAH